MVPTDSFPFFSFFSFFFFSPSQDHQLSKGSRVAKGRTEHPEYLFICSPGHYRVTSMALSRHPSPPIISLRLSWGGRCLGSNVSIDSLE